MKNNGCSLSVIFKEIVISAPNLQLILQYTSYMPGTFAPVERVFSFICIKLGRMKEAGWLEIQYDGLQNKFFEKIKNDTYFIEENAFKWKV